MGCCGGENKNAGDEHAGHGAYGGGAGHGAGGNEGQKGINWVQIVALGFVVLFLAGIFAGRH